MATEMDMDPFEGLRVRPHISYQNAAVAACKRLGLTAEQLEGDAIGRLVEAAKKVVGESKNPPKVTWAEDGSPIVDCHDDVSEFLTNWRELESALAPFTK